MNLNDFNLKNLGKDLIENKVLSNFINEFVNELKEYLEKYENKNMIDIKNKYSNYWKYQNFMEDNVAAKIGLSRFGTCITYSKELSKAIDDSIMNLADKEGVIYRKKFSSNGSSKGEFFNVDKFEHGKITHTTIPKEAILKEFENEDLIFQYRSNGTIKIREDLKEEVINLVSQKAGEIRDREKKINAEFKKEGHIYEAFEDDGYIFLNDITEERDFSVEDIDFVVDNYEGEGKYKVINGEYKKID